MGILVIVIATILESKWKRQLVLNAIIFTQENTI
jgi:hypothetical protein